MGTDAIINLWGVPCVVFTISSDDDGLVLYCLTSQATILRVADDKWLDPWFINCALWVLVVVVWCFLDDVRHRNFVQSTILAVGHEQTASLEAEELWKLFFKRYAQQCMVFLPHEFTECFEDDVSAVMVLRSFSIYENALENAGGDLVDDLKGTSVSIFFEGVRHAHSDLHLDDNDHFVWDLCAEDWSCE